MAETEVVPDGLLEHLETMAREAVERGDSKRMATGADIDEETAAEFGAVPGYYKRVGTRQWHRYIRGTVAELMALSGIKKRAVAIKLNTVLETPQGKVAMCEFCFIDVETSRSVLGVGNVQLHENVHAIIGIDARAEIPHDSPFLTGGEAGPWDDLSEQQGSKNHGEKPDEERPENPG